MIRTAVPISVNVDGVQISGFYAVQSNMLTVWHAFLGSRTRTLNGKLASADVEELMTELFHARKMQTRSAGGFWK